MNELRLNTGSVKYVIKDEFGDELGFIKFNPGDLDIVRRYEEVSKWFSSIKVKDDLTMDDFFKLTDEIKAKLDYVLNTNSSETIFKIANPLSRTDDGKVFFLQVLEAVEKIISKSMKNKFKKFDAAVKDIVE